MLTSTVRYLQTAPFLAIFPGVAIVHLGARVQPDRRRPARGARPEAAGTRMTLADAAPGSRGPRGPVLDEPRASCTPSTASRSTSRRARRSASSASRAAGRASRRSRCSASCRARDASPRAARASTGSELTTMSDSQLRSIRGRQIAMIFQDPMTSLNPVLTIGRQLREPLETHLGLNKKEALGARRGAARQRRHPERPRAAARLPAPVLGRDAPARDDRDGARVRAEAADRRRADDRARRDDPGADPRPAARARRGARHRADHDHARPRRGRRHLRARRGDVRRHVRRGRHRRRDLRLAAPSVHARPARERAAARTRAAPRR